MYNEEQPKIISQNFLFFKKSNDEKIIMIIKWVVYIPRILDDAGDILTEKEIRKAALLFNRQVNLIDVQNTLQSIRKLLESYISDTEIEFQYMLK